MQEMYGEGICQLMMEKRLEMLIRRKKRDCLMCFINDTILLSSHSLDKRPIEELSKIKGISYLFAKDKKDVM